MSRELIVGHPAVDVDEETEDVLVCIHTDTERDLSVRHDAEDLILWVARLMGWSVMIDKRGGAETDLGVSGG